MQVCIHSVMLARHSGAGAGAELQQTWRFNCQGGNGRKVILKRKRYVEIQEMLSVEVR